MLAPSLQRGTTAEMSSQIPTTPPLATERRGAVFIITLDHAPSRNALSEAMLAALQTAIDTASAEPAIHAVIIQANGPAFSAGHDLKELTRHRADADRGRAYFTTVMGQCAALMQSIVRCPKPVIAAVEGVATAAGCQLVATCDLAVAGTAAKFATPGVNIGLFCSTPMVALSRNVPRKRAMEMLLLGELLDANAAAAHGLVNRVVAPDKVRAEALNMAQQIAAKSPVTVAIGKQAFYAQIEQPLADAYAHAADTMVRNMLERDAAEGIGAFIDKRAPKWGG
jgi:enoyl-CoA hydratase/carnithine racemase